MTYIVFDLELNSKVFKSRVPNEIIEIGAVKLNDHLEIIDTFQSFVKPKVYKKLFSVIKQKTKITQEDINHAEPFKVVIRDFKEWVGEDYTLCSWGYDDIHHLKTNSRFNRLSTRWIQKHIDIQKHFSKIHQCPTGQVFSLSKGLELMNIPVGHELHRADIDAEYTAKIFIKIFSLLDPDSLYTPVKKAKKLAPSKVLVKL